MADKSEPGPDGIDAALAWLRGDINERSPRKLLARRTFARMLRESPEAPVLSILAAAIEDGRLIMKRKPGRRRRVQPQRIAAFVSGYNRETGTDGRPRRDDRRRIFPALRPAS
jgi:hypothetical protein